MNKDPYELEEKPAIGWCLVKMAMQAAVVVLVLILLLMIIVRVL